MPPTGVLFTRSDFRNEISDVEMKEKEKEAPTKLRKKRRTFAAPNTEKDVLAVANVSPKTLGLKRKRVRSSLPTTNVEPKRLHADENLIQSGGEDDHGEGVQPKFSISKASTSKGDEMTNVARKGEYYVKNAEGVPTEKYSMVFRNLLHNGEDIDEDSGDEMQMLLSDKWKTDYNNGVQMLVKPDELPKFETKDFDFEIKKKTNFELPSKLVSIRNLSSNETVPDYVNEETHETIFQKPQRLYEGDKMDMTFVRKLNLSRPTSEKTPWLTTETFLTIMDALEVECYKNIHEILLKPLHSPATRDPNGTDDEAACDVCRIAECEVDDEMVFCDGCNVCVHMSCYGLTELPAGEWLCLKCALCHGNNPPCVFCPTIGGAMKCTKHKDRWAHVVCALWLPECRFGDVEKREPILAIEEIADERWQLKCSVCDTRQGACIQCTKKECSASFHVTCALRSGFTMKIEQDPNDPDQDRVQMISLCKKHSINLPTSDEGTISSTENNDQLAKLERYFYLYADYEKVAEKIKLPELLVSDVYEYWKQKREENGGKSLIINPHDNIVIDPETISLKLPSTSMTPRPGGRGLPKTPLIPNLMEQKRRELRKLRAAVDKDRNMLTMVVRREKLKRQKIQTEKVAILELCEFAMKAVLSNRSAEGLVEMLEEILAPNEIEEGRRLATNGKYMINQIKNLNNKNDVSMSDLKWDRSKMVEKRAATQCQGEAQVDSFLEEEFEEEEEHEEEEEEEKEEVEEKKEENVKKRRRRRRRRTSGSCSTPKAKRQRAQPTTNSAPAKEWRKNCGLQ